MKYLGLFILILLCRCATIHHYGVNGLAFDQWNGVVKQQLIPWATDTWHPASLFTDYNQHRMLFQKVWDIALFELNGSYDNLTWCYANAVFYSGILTLFTWMFVSMTEGKGRWWILASFACLGCLPFAYENSLGGFQSQVYWMILFNVLACWCYAVQMKPECILCCICSLFTLGSGFLVAMALLGLYLFSGGRGLWFISSLIIVTLAGLLLTKSGHYSNEGMKAEGAHGVVQFALGLGRCLAWPGIVWPWFCLIVLSPAACVFLPIKIEASAIPGINFMVALLAWITLEAVAAAYSRGSVQSGPVPYVRYEDWLALILPIGVVLLILTGQRGAFAMAWGISMTYSLFLLSYKNFATDLDLNKAVNTMWCKNTAYLYHTGNYAAFNGQPDVLLPWPAANEFAAFLQSDGVKHVVNVEVFEP